MVTVRAHTFRARALRPKSFVSLGTPPLLSRRYLFGLHPPFISEIHRTIKGQLLVCRKVPRTRPRRVQRGTSSRRARLRDTATKSRRGKASERALLSREAPGDGRTEHNE
eukprot:4735734-Pleurochrysis_carterae.AAC.3